jgi:hypothetical protein
MRVARYSTPGHYPATTPTRHKALDHLFLRVAREATLARIYAPTERQGTHACSHGATKPQQGMRHARIQKFRATICSSKASFAGAGYISSATIPRHSNRHLYTRGHRARAQSQAAPSWSPMRRPHQQKLALSKFRTRPHMPVTPGY